MALVKDKPRNIPSGNALDEIPDDLLGAPPQSALMLGANKLLMLDYLPKKGEYLDVTLRLRVKGRGDSQPTVDSDTNWQANGVLVGAWIKGEPEPPMPDDDPPALLADDGMTPTGDDDGDQPDNVARPDFSDGSK